MLSNSSVILASNSFSVLMASLPNNLSKNSWFKSASSKRLMFLTVN